LASWLTYICYNDYVTRPTKISGILRESSKILRESSKILRESSKILRESSKILRESSKIFMVDGDLNST